MRLGILVMLGLFPCLAPAATGEGPPLAPLVDMGLGRFEGPPPAGVAAVELNPLIHGQVRLGPAPLSRKPWRP